MKAHEVKGSISYAYFFAAILKFFFSLFFVFLYFAFEYISYLSITYCRGGDNDDEEYDDQAQQGRHLAVFKKRNILHEGYRAGAGDYV